MNIRRRIRFQLDFQNKRILQKLLTNQAELIDKINKLENLVDQLKVDVDYLERDKEV